ncbi:MAG TPA: right-handed parallel beta-helix repeat-containing protein [Stellaceae bacterium]|nr:right-handed parallel beta-helix repeat-containing protein [Stellaceae bacterium]
MTVLTVGAGQEYSTLTAAVAASHNGDTIDVQPGTYVNDFPTVTDSITIESVGGMAYFKATEPPTNLKAILTVGLSAASNINVTVIGLGFEGAAISAADGGNAAGIRFQSGNLTVEDCYFQGNQMGILTNNLASSSITVENSEFAGQSTFASDLAHQIYVGQIGSATIENNLFLANSSGHQIKDRAETSLISHNTIDDGTGYTSYDIDLANGGNATVTGNSIIKGVNDPNTTVIIYGEGGMIWSNNALTVSNNIIDNQLTGNHGIGVYNFSSVVAQIDNNQFYHLPTVAIGPNSQSGNVTLTTAPTITDTNPIELPGGSTGPTPTKAVAPTLTVANSTVQEGAAIPLHITAAQASPGLDPSNLTVTIWGADKLNEGTHNANGTWTLTEAQLSGLTINMGTAYVGSHVLKVQATDTEPSSHTSASSPIEMLTIVSTATTTAASVNGVANALDDHLLTLVAGGSGNAPSSALPAHVPTQDQTLPLEHVLPLAHAQADHFHLH